MLKKIFTYAVPACVLLFASVFYACHKDGASLSILDPAAPMSIGLAEHYFYNDLMKQLGSFYAPKTPGGKANWKYVLFKKGYASQTPAATFVEIPLLYNQRPSVLVISSAPFSGAAQQGNGSKIAENTAPGGGTVMTPMASPADVDHLNGTFDRLIIFKNKLTQQVDQSIVTYIPDQDYLARHHNDVSHNQITKLDSDFNGYLQYRNWDDKLQFVLQIRNGKSVKVLKYNSSGVSATAAPRSVTAGSAQRQTDAIVCTQQTIYHFEQMCYYTVTEEGTFESCQDWEYTGSDTYTSCYDDGSGDPATGNPCIDYGYCTTPVPPSTPPPAPTSVNTIENDIKNLCLQAVFTAIGKDRLLNTITSILETFGTDTKYKYVFSDTYAGSNPASTTPIKNSNGVIVGFNINLNPTLTSGDSQEAITEIIDHEIFHAYFSTPAPGLDPTTQSEQHDMMLNSFLQDLVYANQAVNPGLSTRDATALSMYGVSTLNYFDETQPNFQAALQKNNLTLADLNNTYLAYTAGVNGVQSGHKPACPH